MSDIRYGKPSMTNLPYELGKSIFDEIMNSKPVDRQAMRREADELEKQIIEARKAAKNGK